MAEWFSVEINDDLCKLTFFALKINEWKQHNYIVVINLNGKITGTLTKDILENPDYIKNKNSIVIESVMKKNLVTIEPNQTIYSAIKMMKKHKINMLPVTENKLFIGMLQKKFLIQYEFDSPT